MGIKQTISNFVAQSKLDDALETFYQWASANNSDLANQLILLKGQHATLKRNETMGLLAYSEISRDRAKLSNAILALTAEITEGGGTPTVVSGPASNTGGTAPGSSGTGSGTATILFLASNPSNTGKLQLEKEFLRVFQSLRESEHTYELQTEFAITPGDLQRVILKHRPKIIHFSGHGVGNGGQGEADARGIGAQPSAPAGILLQDGNGQSKLVSGAALAGLFGICLKKFKIDVVVLNACHSEEQAKSISAAGIPFVVGMNTAVRDDTAIEFSTGFYRGIGTEGGDVEFAFDLAKNAIMLQGLSGDDIPVLYKK